MDAATRASTSLDDSEWERLGYVNLPKLRLNNLAREISPVFRYTDERDKIRWTGISRRAYQIIEPVCRLASTIIESPASLAFLHALMYSSRTEITGLSQRAGYPCYSFRRSRPSSIQDSENPRLALKRLAPNINWVVVDSAEIFGCNGFTTTEWVGCHIVDNGRNGFQCTIMLRKGLIVDLFRLSQQADRAMQTLSNQFLLAVILCHEVVHACNVAVDPALIAARKDDLARRAIRSLPQRWLNYYEPFFEDQAESELGHCWENEVFGGSIVPNYIAEPLVMCKWPNFVLSSAKGTDPPPPRRIGHKATQTLYIIPAHFIQNIQQQAFWDRLGPADATSLRVQKTTGLRRPIPPETWKDVNWKPSTSSEGDWSADEHSWVHREEEPYVVALRYSAANHAATTKWVMELPDPAL